MKYPEIYVQANVCFLYIWKQTTIFEEDCSHLLGKEDSQTEGSQYQKCPPLASLCQILLLQPNNFD